MKKDVSVLIVHHSTPKLLRQTLKGLFSTKTSVDFEVIVVDNNPNMRVDDMIHKEFPQVRLLISYQNLGFGGGMHYGIQHAYGRYLFVFNPDILMLDGVLEELTFFLDQHQDVGMVAPQLLNPDRSLQHSCYRFMKPKIVLYRRLPFLRIFPCVKRAIDTYLMKDVDHTITQDVDYILGAAMFMRREVYEALGGFDPNFFVYFEEQDLCRRFWKAGWRVVYHPKATLIHYHRRETAEGGFFHQLLNPITRIQMKSALYYFRKYRGEANPHKIPKEKLPNTNFGI